MVRHFRVSSTGGVAALAIVNASYVTAVVDIDALVSPVVVTVVALFAAPSVTIYSIATSICIISFEM